MQDKISKLKNLLLETKLERESGAIIYSADSTLKKGDFYFLGTNPGGNRLDYPDTILNQVKLSREKNEYTDGNWGNSEHQETIKAMFRELDINLKETFSTNASFIRSPREQEYKPRYPIDEEKIKDESRAIKQLKKDAEETFWPIQEYFLSIVRPKLIIANGHIARGLFWKKIKRTAFSDNKINIEDKFEYPKTIRGKKSCHFFEGDLRTNNLFIEDLKVVSVPHLSFQDYSFHKLGVQWAKEKIRNNI
tara:strand:+ start:481 stop:1227 length:747 start_codon:yes stop_codon:yes gene_type:complete